MLDAGRCCTPMTWSKGRVRWKQHAGCCCGVTALWFAMYWRGRRTCRELLGGFRRLEDRGEIRGGRFVDGFLGEQFALPVAVESVRAMRKLDAEQGEITLSAADPLNLVGILVPGERVPAISGNSVTYRGGAAVSLPMVEASAGNEAVAS